jgi:hypothetical protein
MANSSQRVTKGARAKGGQKMANGALPHAIAKRGGTASLKAVLLAPALEAAPATLDDRPGLHLGDHRRHGRSYRHTG